MDYWFVLLNLAPTLENRAGIIYGNAVLGMPLWLSFVLSTMICILVSPIILLVMDKLDVDNIFYKLLSKYAKNKVKKAKYYVNKYGPYGIILFVAIPLPGTGVYTGSIVAGLLGMDKKPALISIAIGAAIAGLIVSLGVSVWAGV